MSSDQGDLTVMASVTVDDRGIGDRTDLAPTSLVGRYQTTRRIGKGGMGEVMGARDEQVGRDVAIKRMRKANPSQRAIARFLREATIQGRLEHPAIVPVHEIGRDTDGLPFFVMKKLSGTTLAKILERPGGDRTSFPLQRVLRAFAEVCLAIEFAHVRGIVHRDLKPDNIMLGDFGEVYVLDWGVAKVIGEDDGHFADVGSSAASGEHATQAGTAIGTPGYMAPEQVQGWADVDGRCDVYTLGCLLFEILTGEPLHPRGPDGLRSAVRGIDARPSVRAPGRDIPPELDALCVEATRADRDERIATARELGDRVQRFLDGDRDVALRRGLAEAHLAAATAAFDAGDGDDARATAMREAAAAMALDPALPGPPALIGRLMLEPPKDTPRAVAEEIRASDERAARDHGQAGIWTLVASLAFTPMVWWIAPSGSPYVGALTAVLLVNLLVLLFASYAKVPRPGLALFANLLVVMLMARMYSPLFIAPGLASVLAMAMVLVPRFSIVGSAWTIGTSLLVAILGPLALEWFGVLSPTMSIDSRGVLFSAPAFAGNAGPTVLVGILYSSGLVIGACAMGGVMRQRAREAQHHMQLQAWQLRQLVPQRA